MKPTVVVDYANLWRKLSGSVKMRKRKYFAFAKVGQTLWVSLIRNGRMFSNRSIRKTARFIRNHLKEHRR